MIHEVGLVRAIALWEFQRFFKWKDQLRGVLIGVLCAALGYAVVAVVVGERPATQRVAVVHGERLALSLAEGSDVVLEPADVADAAALAEQVGRRERAGVLTIDAPDRVTLLVFQEAPWMDGVRAAVAEAQLQRRMAALGLTAAQMADLHTAHELTVAIHPSGRAPSTTGNKVAAGVLIGLMLVGVVHAMGLFMVAVTGEKQLRVTEQILAAVPPQVWIDGKLIGLTLASVGSMVSISISGLALFVAWQLWQAGTWQVPEVVLDPGLVTVFVVLCLLGLLFWSAFFAAVAAMIDDPNTSARSGLLALPILPVALCFFALAAPESRALQWLSVVPGFSSALLPARMVLTTIAWWEVPLAVLALGIGVWLMRRLAGRIFQAAILMVGKEPTWRETWRWLREG